MTTALATPENTALTVRPGGDAAADGVDDGAQRRAQLDLADVGRDDVADDGGHDGAGRLGRCPSSGTTRPPGEDVRHVGQRLDVVDEGRVRAAALGPGRGVASHPICGAVANRPCSYGGNQRGSGGLPSMTSSIAFSSPNRYSSGPATMVTCAVAADAGLLHLLHGPGDGARSRVEAALEADERLDGADGEGGDHDALDDLVRVGAQQRPVLERARLALGAVAHDVAAGPGLGRDAGPLAAGREAAAPAAAQAGRERSRRWSPPARSAGPARGRARPCRWPGTRRAT